MLSIIMVTGNHFFKQATNTKSKPLLVQALVKSGSKKATEWLSEDWVLIIRGCFSQKPPVRPYLKILPFQLWIKINVLTS